MTDITQADRDAANEAQRNAIMRVGSMHEAFARHREAAAAEECAKIVAYLRKTFGFDSDAADAIEAKEHLTIDS